MSKPRLPEDEIDRDPVLGIDCELRRRVAHTIGELIAERAFSIFAAKVYRGSRPNPRTLDGALDEIAAFADGAFENRITQTKGCVKQ